MGGGGGKEVKGVGVPHFPPFRGNTVCVCVHVWSVCVYVYV